MSEHDRHTGAKLFRMEARMTELVTVGLLAEGLRMHNSFEGTIVEGVLTGAQIRGIDEFVIRPDGVGIVDAREVVNSADGAMSAEVFGYGHPPAGLQMPPLEVFLDPAFVWPDVRFSLECGAIYRSSAPSLAEMCRTVVVHIGHVNMCTGELVIEGFRGSAVAQSGAASLVAG